MNIISTLSSVFTFFFLIIILSYYVLLFIKRKKGHIEKNFSSITVIIPAHNEERYIDDCIKSVLDADFNGEKEIIVIDDGSSDKTADIVSNYEKKGIIFLRSKHEGKSASINKALKKAKGELIAIVDGDSVIHKDSLVHMTKAISEKDVVGTTGVIKVKNRNRLVCMWVHIEQLYNSLMRLLFTKINANISTPGPLSVYRKESLMNVGGFSTDGFSEDLDITIKLIRDGGKVVFVEKAQAETNMPYRAEWFFKQRSRFARGMLKIFKKHISLNTTAIDLYTLPLWVFGYLQAVIMGSINIYQIVSGYYTYFLSKGIIMNGLAARFFLEWFSIVGFVKWIFNIVTGVSPLTLIAAIGILSTLLTYPLYMIAIIKFDKKIDFRHIIPIFFMFPFWFLIMIIYIIWVPELFRKKQHNIWTKKTT